MCAFCSLSFVGLAEPQAAMLPGYEAALRRGWSPSTTRDVSGEHRSAIETDAEAFLHSVSDEGGRWAGPADADGHVRLPRRVRWIWDGDFCGAISLRWQPGTDALPDHVLGHIGYSVVPWKRGNGYAKAALRHVLAEAADLTLTGVEVWTTTDNPASQRVIEANGGRLMMPAFVHPQHGPAERLRYRIAL